MSALAGERVPGEHWMRYADPAEAGFDAAQLETARATWEGLPSSAFMVIADGAVVAAWGDVSRRFMCHSVRKSFMSALYGIVWDRGDIELNKTLADLGIDDIGAGLLETEKQARILDLLKARSGIFHPAAYAGRTDTQPRGSQGPGRYFAYNNWDFNTLVTILEQETGEKVFEAFDEYFAGPLGMEDWRVSDGYYHYELEKSMHPAYPFRLSARDAARFGLLFANGGTWPVTQLGEPQHHSVLDRRRGCRLRDAVVGVPRATVRRSRHGSGARCRQTDDRGAPRERSGDRQPGQHLRE
jgi:CubicO group peptidase (beta-lactamase class C family)